MIFRSTYNAIYSFYVHGKFLFFKEIIALQGFSIFANVRKLVVILLCQDTDCSFQNLL